MRPVLLATLPATLLATPGIAQLPPVVDLGDLSGIEHGRFAGGLEDDRAGLRVHPAGDVNGDGIDDFLISGESYETAPLAGAIYVVFGRPGLLDPGPIDLTTLDGGSGALQYGASILSRLGLDASAIGDFNQDGYDDIAVGSLHPWTGPGGVYVLFGGPTFGAGGELDLLGLDGTDGFKIEGPYLDAFTGASVTGIGDFNEDGAPDLLVGATRADDWESFVDKPGYSRLTSGDLDGDGDDDLVAIYNDPRGITSWFNDGSGNLSLVQSLTPANIEPWFVKLADIDGDLDLDLLYTGHWSHSQQLRIIFNPGNGNLAAPPVAFPLPACHAPFEVGDVDGDLDLDVVVVSYRGSTCFGGGTGKHLDVFLNDGLGTLAPLPTATLQGEPDHVDLGDVDGDSILDAIVTYGDGTPVQVLRGNGAGRFTAHWSAVTGGGYTFSFADVELDGDLDILGTRSGDIVLYRGDGAGGFAPAEITEDSFLSETEVVDMNGDGYPELIGSSSQDEFAFCLNNGDGTFELNYDYDAGDQSVNICTLDLNGDGLPGVAAIELNTGEVRLFRSMGGGNLDGKFRGDAYVVFGGAGVGASGTFPLAGINGTNGFRIEGPHGHSGFGGSSAALGDINGDAVPDVAIAAPGMHSGHKHTGAVMVLFGGAGMGATGKIQWSEIDGSNGFVIPGLHREAYLPYSVAGGDVNGDGLGDLVMGAPTHDVGNLAEAGETFVVLGGAGVGAAGSLDLLTLDGTNGHVFQGYHADGRAGYRVASGGDFNSDGFDDILIGSSLGVGQDGEAFLVYGGAHIAGVAAMDLGALDGTTGSRFLAAASGDRAGTGVGFLGDVDHDGATELAIGAPFHDHFGDDDGMVYLLPGPSALCTDDIGVNYCDAAPHSRGTTGVIAAQGSSTLADDCLSLFAGQLPHGQFGYFLGSQTQAFVAQAGGSDGNLCLGGQISRFVSSLQNTGQAGQMLHDLDLSAFPLHGAVQPGETWNFQTWFRDVNPGPTSNFTDGISMTFQ